jgi:hypothetical protein
VRRAVVAPLIAAMAAAGGAWLSSWVVRHLTLPVPARLAVALLPAPLFVWFILAELAALRRLDEFHRRVLLDALAIAFPAAILVGVTIDALQKGGFVTDWSVGDVWPFMALLWVPALWLAYRHYDRNG